MASATVVIMRLNLRDILLMAAQLGNPEPVTGYVVVRSKQPQAHFNFSVRLTHLPGSTHLEFLLCNSGKIS